MQLDHRVTGSLLIDNSAWARLGHTALGAQRSEWAAEAAADGRIVVCLPFLLEAGYSARNAADHDRLLGSLLELPRVAIDDAIEGRALDAQRQLARAGHHRVAPPDVIIAAAADCNGLGVLHYDGDYDVIAERTDLVFDSVWVAERGSL
ncbi:MAG: PIN domain-containing protein [Thermoleophilaceae bacterium]